MRFEPRLIEDEPLVLPLCQAAVLTNQIQLNNGVGPAIMSILLNLPVHLALISTVGDKST